MMHIPEDHDGVLDKWLEQNPDIRKFLKTTAIVVTVSFFVGVLLAMIVAAHYE